MILHLLGVHHRDPLSRIKCADILSNLAQSYPCDPSFVATEWDSEHAAQVKAQRPRLRQLLKSKWPTADTELLDYMEKTLGFEADVHELFWPNLEIVWLDQGRSADASGLAEHVFYPAYQHLLRDQKLLPDNSITLKLLQERLWEQTRGHVANYDRDLKWISLPKFGFIQGSDVWAIAIVGAAHVLPEPNSFRSLLEARGQELRATICGP